MQLMLFNTADLRVADNTALHFACSAGPTIAAFVITPEQYIEHNDAEIKQDFWYRNLLELKSSLSALNIPLLILQAKRFEQVPALILEVCLKHSISEVHFNQQYEVNEKQMQQDIMRRLEKNQIKTESYIDQVIFEPGRILTGKGDFYTVFTPFKKNFIKTYQACNLQVFEVPKKQEALLIESTSVEPWLTVSNMRDDLWPAGEKTAHQRLRTFIQERVQRYKAQRDIPALNGTSTLSPYLMAGVLSIRQCFSLLDETFPGERSEGVLTWQSELIWREFYKHILVGYPRVSMHRAFKSATDKISWNQNDEHLLAWQEGRTGIPIVDAAMRQLNQTGWMHNRLRMVAAMFLSKNLFLNWRLGEAYFMQKLIDGDLSANNGGWQWSASTGTDAAPYFRVFNPVSQSQRFDPQGYFIKKFVPELSEYSAKDIHDPWKAKNPLTQLSYPKPIVDLKTSRQFAIDQFKQLSR